MARAGVGHEGHVHGFETNLALAHSRLRVSVSGLSERVTIHWRNMFDADAGLVGVLLQCTNPKLHSSTALFVTFAAFEDW